MDDDDPQETSFDLGKTMGRSAEFRMLWKPMGKPWETHGKPMGKCWTSAIRMGSDQDDMAARLSLRKFLRQEAVDISKSA